MATRQAHDKLNFRFKPKEELLDEDFRERAFALAEEGHSWDEVADELGVSKGLASVAAKAHEQGMIPFRNQDELAKKVVKERDNGVPWAIIGARAGGLSESRVQSLYEEASGKEYVTADIGKGGRPKGSSNGEAKTKSTKSKAKAKGKSAKKAPAKKGKAKAKAEYPFADVDNDGADDDKVEEAILGSVVTVDRPGGKRADVEVGEVVKFANSKNGARAVRVKDTDGKAKTFQISKIVSVA